MSHTPDTIASVWDDFRRNTINPDASPEQVFEMKATFYAGAFSSIMIMTQIASEGLSNDVAMTRMNALHAEIANFRKELVQR